MLGILNVGTVPSGCVLNAGTVPQGCILNIGTSMGVLGSIPQMIFVHLWDQSHNLFLHIYGIRPINDCRTPIESIPQLIFVHLWDQSYM